MTDEIQLTDKANYLGSDKEAIRNLMLSQQIIINFLEQFVQVTNQDNPEALEYWNVAKGLNAAVEVYCG